MRRSHRTIATLGVALLFVLGCDRGITQLVVAVDTDLTAPEEIDRIRIVVDGFGPQPVVAATLPGPHLPLTTGLVHEGGPLGPISIDVTGYERFSEVILERRARVFFIEDSMRLLQINLLRKCLDVDCPDGQTCGEGGCRPVEVDASELAEWTNPPQPLVPDHDDGATPDTADADPLDAGGSDADASDADASDGGTTGCGSCGPGGGCANGCCVGICPPGESCDYACDPGCGCKLVCQEGSECDLSCDGAVECTMDCRGARDCAVRCVGRSQCLVECDRTAGSSCVFTECEGGQSTCTDGSIACNRPCGTATITPAP